MNKIIICLDNNNWATTLTLNKEYIVTKEDDTYYYFTDDKNVDKAGYYKSRFKVKEMKPKLNLADKTQIWCVESKNRKLINYLNQLSPNANYAGTSRYYGRRSNLYNNNTDCSISSWGIEYTIEEFLEALQEYENPWQPKCGDIVEVSSNGKEWSKRRYLTSTEANTYIAVNKDQYYSIGANTQFSCSVWSHMRKKQDKVEISITCTINGKVKDPKDFTDEEWLALKNK